MAQAYEGKGDIDKAIEVLEKGYEMTGSADIMAMLERLKAHVPFPETET